MRALRAGPPGPGLSGLPGRSLEGPPDGFDFYHNSGSRTRQEISGSPGQAPTIRRMSLSMNTDDIRNHARTITNVACEAWSDYSNLRGYLADRYNDPHPDVTGWLRSKGCVFVDGVPEEEAWQERCWTAWEALDAALRDFDAESDEITQIVYEEALADGEPWAEEAYEHRQGLEPERP